MAATPLRRLAPIALLFAVSPALAAPGDGDPPRPRRIIASPKPADDLGLRPALSLAPPPDLSLKPAAQPGAAFLSKGIGAGGLAAAGLRSTLPHIGDEAGQCRTACAERRITCDAEDTGPECAPKWAQCVAACSH